MTLPHNLGALCLLFLIVAIPEIPSRIAVAAIAKHTKPTMETSIQSEKLQSLESEKRSLKKMVEDLEGKQDFWNSWYFWLGLSAIAIGVILGSASWVSQKRASDNSYRARPLLARIASIDEQMGQTEKALSDIAVSDAQRTASLAESHARELDTKNIELKGRLDKQVEDSKRKFEEQRRDNLELETGLSNARKDLEIEREKRLAMELRIAPRRLEEPERTKFVRELKVISSPLMKLARVEGCPHISVLAVMNDLESNEYASAILDAFKDAPDWN
jgi:hypothetical protein